MPTLAATPQTPSDTRNEPTTRVCSVCRTAQPAERFALQRKGGTRRRSACNRCRTWRERVRTNRASEQEFRNYLREVRKSSPSRMAAIVEMMVARFGGVNAMGRRWAQLCESGGESFRRQTLRTLMVIDAGAAHALAAEMELYTAKLRSGQASAEDVTDALAKLGEDEVIDLACDSLQPLAEGDLLPSILIRMHKRGMLDDAQLKAVQRAVA